MKKLQLTIFVERNLINECVDFACNVVCQEWKKSLAKFKFFRKVINYIG